MIIPGKTQSNYFIMLRVGAILIILNLENGYGLTKYIAYHMNKIYRSTKKSN